VISVGATKGKVPDDSPMCMNFMINVGSQILSIMKWHVAHCS
jgi:hypothetical protein